MLDEMGDYRTFSKGVLESLLALIEKDAFRNKEEIPRFCEGLRDFYVSLFEGAGTGYRYYLLAYLLKGSI